MALVGLLILVSMRGVANTCNQHRTQVYRRSVALQEKVIV